MKSYIKNITLVATVILLVSCSSNNNIFSGEKTNSETETAQSKTSKQVETKKTDGAIMGSVIAPNSEISIIATNSEKVISGTTNDVGEFFITGFPEGTYTVKIKTDENETPEQVFEDVKVNIGEVTALGTVTVASN